jgi:hypothetical protein
MYNRILSAIKEDDRPYAIRILRWLAFSSRPLLLAEVAEVAALDSDRCPTFDRDEILQDPWDVLSICSSLVTVNVTASVNANTNRVLNTLRGPVVLLAHYSVKEYLTSERIFDSTATTFGLNPALCHEKIAQCCIQYLLQFDRPSALTEEHLNEYPLAEYSAQYWVSHTKADLEDDAEKLAMILELLNTNETAYLTSIRLHDPDSFSEGTNFGLALTDLPSPLYHASQIGLPVIVKRLIEDSRIDVNVQGGKYDNPLQAASSKGHLDVVEILVSKGANVNAQGGFYGNALHAALFCRHSDVVRFLLDNNACVDTSASPYGNALQMASFWGRSEMMQMLVEKSTAIDAQGGYYGNALQTASFRGHKDIVLTLLKNGADVNAQGGEFVTALQAALAVSHIDITWLLVDEGADVNARRRVQ